MLVVPETRVRFAATIVAGSIASLKETLIVPLSGTPAVPSMGTVEITLGTTLALGVVALLEGDVHPETRAMPTMAMSNGEISVRMTCFMLAVPSFW
jgi:hypothetical protein